MNGPRLGGIAVAAACWLCAAPAAANRLPAGFIDGVRDGKAWGWAYDPDAAEQSITVHIYVGAPAGQPGARHVGIVQADRPRPDLNSGGIPGNHGFEFELPADLRMGFQRVWAYGIDSNGIGPNGVLNGSPKEHRPSGQTGQAEGNLAIRGVFEGSPIEVHTSKVFAGAVSAIIWRNMNFVNIWDHGRQFQTAVNYGGLGECDNPTEAGTAKDFQNPYSSSVLLDSSASGDRLSTYTQMAYWMEPGQPASTAQCSGGAQVARNTTVLSDTKMRKEVTVGFRLPDGSLVNALDWKVSVEVPRNESDVVFQTVAAFTTHRLNTFYAFDPYVDKLIPMSHVTHGEETAPTIIATQDGSHAVAVFAPDLPNKEVPEGGYALHRFDYGTPNLDERTNLLACVHRHPRGLAAGTYDKRCFLPIGTLAGVVESLRKLHRYWNEKGTLDVASCDALEGWACNESLPGEPIAVHIYDGPADGGGRKIGEAVADRPREAAVGGLCGGNAGRGYRLTTPPEVKDGREHRIYAYAIAKRNARNPLLAGSGKPLTCSPVAGGGGSSPATANASPPPVPPQTGAPQVRGGPAVGFLDMADCNSIRGWACKPGSPATLKVHLYDGPAGGGGRLITEITANEQREAAVGAACGGSSRHGYVFETPWQLRTGGVHEIYAYAIDPDGPVNPMLHASGKRFSCAAGAGTAVTASNVQATSVQAGGIQASGVQPLNVAPRIAVPTSIQGSSISSGFSGPSQIDH